MAESNGTSIQGDVNTGGDFIGRDQIQNIIIVGRFLDYTGIQGLIPQIKDLTDVDTVAAALDEAIRQRAEGDLTQAVTFAGSLLRDLLPSGGNFSAGRPVPYKEIASCMAKPLISRPKNLGYWEDLCHFNNSYRGEGVKFSHIPLESTTALFKKYFDQEIYQTIAIVEGSSKNEQPGHYFCFVLPPVGLDKSPSFQPINFQNWDSREFRVFFTGLVLDLIRIAATVEGDHRFWDSLIGLLGPESD